MRPGRRYVPIAVWYRSVPSVRVRQFGQTFPDVVVVVIVVVLSVLLLRLKLGLRNP